MVALRALLPATAQLAVGWRDATLGSHFLMEPVMQAGPARRLELALVEAGSLGNEPDTLSLAWHDAEDARLSLVARLGGPFDPAAREAWLATARTLLESALEATRAQARMEALEKSRQLQQALYEIAELASAEVEMGEMLHRLHAIIG